MIKGLLSNETLRVYEELEQSIIDISSFYIQRFLSFLKVISFNVDKDDIIVMGTKNDGIIFDPPHIFQLNLLFPEYKYYDYIDDTIKVFKIDPYQDTYNLPIKSGVYNYSSYFYFDPNPNVIMLQNGQLIVNNNTILTGLNYHNNLLLPQLKEYEDGQLYTIINPLLNYYTEMFFNIFTTPGVFDITKNIILIVNLLKELLYRPRIGIVTKLLNKILGFKINNEPTPIQVIDLPQHPYLDRVYIYETEEVLDYYYLGSNIYISLFNCSTNPSLPISSTSTVYIITDNTDYDFVRVPCNVLTSIYPKFNDVMDFGKGNRYIHSLIVELPKYYIYNLTPLKQYPPVLNHAIITLINLNRLLPAKIKLGFYIEPDLPS